MNMHIELTGRSHTEPYFTHNIQVCIYVTYCDNTVTLLWKSNSIQWHYN